VRSCFPDSFRPVRWLPRVAAAAFVCSFVGCGAAEEPLPPEIRPVRAMSVEALPGGERVTLTGRIDAEEEVNLAFRTGQRLIERAVNVGDRVEPGQLVARLDATTLENAAQAARADVAAANARLADARLEFERQRTLLERGVAPRAVFERAQTARDTAAAALDAAQAQLANAREQLSFAALYADSAGSVTAVGAEPGEVVAAGQMIVRVARQGGRDAVFDVPARVMESASGLDPEVTVALASDPSVRTIGRVREVSPQADPVTRTFEVKVGLTEPPDAMRLGSTVTGSIHVGEGEGIRIPASALTASEGEPAVFVLDVDTGIVELRRIEIAGQGLSEVEVARGLTPDEVVVTAGVQTLRPGQQVRLLRDVP
jgi:membrane fusion protein, multidrug efflux system